MDSLNKPNRFRKITDNGYVYTLDIDPYIEADLIDRVPVSEWRYCNDRSLPFPISPTHSRVQVLRRLYIEICLRWG